MGKNTFKEKVLEIVRSIPKGKIMNYGQVALVIGFPRGAQAVGWSLHTIKEKDHVPWWRVVNKEGYISTSCSTHTAIDQKSLLEKDGLIVKKMSVDLERHQFWPSEKRLAKFKLSGQVAFRIEELSRKTDINQSS